MAFEANRGQASSQVSFVGRGASYALSLLPSEAMLALLPTSVTEKRGQLAKKGVALRLKLLGANPKATAAGRDELPGKVNYFRGKDSSEWRKGIPTFAKVACEDVYPGVDLYWYGKQGQLEYDFIVAPGADPRQITMLVEGARSQQIDSDGDLILRTDVGNVRQAKPVIYQMIDGVRKKIEGGYASRGRDRVGFQIADWDTTKPLVIDPTLTYSTLLGGSSDEFGQGIAVDATGSAYLVGYTGSSDFPITPGAFDTSQNGGEDVFVAKLNTTGTALDYSTFLGGGSSEAGYGIAMDSSGSAYVTGVTSSSDFPTTPGAFDTSFNGGNSDAFVAKLNSSGALDYSTFLGGGIGNRDSAYGIAVDNLGSAYVTGATDSPDFPTTPGAFDTSFNSVVNTDVFVNKLNPSGSVLVYSTFLGGSNGSFNIGYGIAVDTLGSAYVIGATDASDFPSTAGAFDPTFNGGASDAFVTKLNPTGSALAYSTSVGGVNNEEGHGIAVDASGSAYVTGYTASPDFPTTSGSFDTSYNFLNDVFVAKLNPTGSALDYSTFLGGADADIGYGIAVNASGSAYITAVTFLPGDSSDPTFPTTPDAFQISPASPANEAFFAKLNPTGSALVYSTFLGGTAPEAGYGIAVDGSGSAYITGITNSSNFPTTPGVFQTSLNGGQDAFVTKFGENPMPTPTPQIGPPTTKDQCKNGGWQQFNTPRAFKNQGDCIQFINTGK